LRTFGIGGSGLRGARRLITFVRFEAIQKLNNARIKALFFQNRTAQAICVNWKDMT
jgi:hypothetical protein